MALSHNPSIVTSGLVLCLDAANKRSYPGSGTAWADVSGNGNTGTLVNGVGYDSDNKGVLTFDGVNDYINLGNPAIDFTNPFSLSVIFFPFGQGESNQNIIDTNSSTNRFRIQYDQPSEGGRLEMWLGDNNTRMTTTVIKNNSWNKLDFIYDSNKLCSAYVNSEFAVSSPGNIKSITTDIFVGRFLGSNVELFNGLISSIQIYNRALSAEEIQQNFVAMRGRFGI